MTKDINILITTWEDISANTHAVMKSEIKRILMDPEGPFKLQPGESVTITHLLGEYDPIGDFAWVEEEPCFFTFKEYGIDKEGYLIVTGEDEGGEYRFTTKELSISTLINIIRMLDIYEKDIQSGRLAIDSNHDINFKEE